MAITLPTEIIKSEIKNPRTMVIYSSPKLGKSSLFANNNLENCLLVDIDPKEGAKYLDAMKIRINSLAELKELGNEIIKAKKPYKYIAIDTITELESWCIPAATEFYKTKTTMGKNFSGDNVLMLPNGAGYLYLRNIFQNYLNFIDTWASNIILVGHLKDKELEKAGKAVSSKDIDLTGKLKQIVCAKADAIGYLRRKEKDKNFISFTPSSTEEITCGSRCDHLRNQDVLISEMISGELKTYWDKIFLKGE